MIAMNIVNIITHDMTQPIQVFSVAPAVSLTRVFSSAEVMDTSSPELEQAQVRRAASQETSQKDQRI